MKNVMALIWFASGLANDYAWMHTQRGESITIAMRAPVRPATRGMRVISSAWASVIGGTMVVRLCASLDCPARGNPGGHDHGHHACIIFEYLMTTG
jgi:hypothetical protein